MKVNQKAVKVLEKLFDAKYTNERAISSLTIDQILALKGVTIPDIAMVNELQKKIRGHEVTAGNTLCINEDFGKIWRKRCKQDACGEILNRL